MISLMFTGIGWLIEVNSIGENTLENSISISDLEGFTSMQVDSAPSEPEIVFSSGK